MTMKRPRGKAHLSPLTSAAEREKRRVRDGGGVVCVSSHKTKPSVRKVRSTNFVSGAHVAALVTQTTHAMLAQ